MELVKYVPYLDIDEHQGEHFVYGLNPWIRAMVKMRRPSSVVGLFECAHYAKENLGIKKEDQANGTPTPNISTEDPPKHLQGR